MTLISRRYINQTQNSTEREIQAAGAKFSVWEALSVNDFCHMLLQAVSLMPANIFRSGDISILFYGHRVQSLRREDRKESLQQWKPQIYEDYSVGVLVIAWVTITVLLWNTPEQSWSRR